MDRVQVIGSEAARHRWLAMTSWSLLYLQPRKLFVLTRDVAGYQIRKIRIVKSEEQKQHTRVYQLWGPLNSQRL